MISHDLENLLSKKLIISGRTFCTGNPGLFSNCVVLFTNIHVSL